MSNISDAIAAAKEAAANLATPPFGGDESSVPQNYSAPSAPAKPFDLDDMLTGNFMVNTWLKVNEFGIFLGKDKTPFQEFVFELDLAAVQYVKRVRFGNPATYRTTYDGVNDAQGGSWGETLTLARNIDPKASEYRSANIAFIAREDIANKNGEVLLEAGKRAGHSLSITGWQAWADFVNEIRANGGDPQNGVIQVKVGFEEQKNQKGTWGTLSFKLVK